jgi:branched-chain amino acid transport system substrate-binding protein
MKRMPLSIASLLLVFALAFPLTTTTAFAAQTVKVGFIFPLTGSLASIGSEQKSATAVAMDIINHAHPKLKGIPLAASKGLPGLDNAQLVPIFVDSQGSPSAGQTQAVRLSTQKNIAAIIGSYQSGVTKTTSRAAERYQIPFLTADSVDATLTKRGFKWFFRTTPNVSQFAGNYMDFFDYLNDHGHTVKTLAVVYENTDYGTSVNKYVTQAAQKAGYKVVAHLSYNHNTTDVTSEVTRLKTTHPDAVIFASYTSDSILYIKTLKHLNYKPKVVIGDDSGFSDPSFITTVGSIAQGALDRSAWSLPPKGSPGFRVNQMYKKKTGHALDGSTSRLIQGILTMAYAIDQAGSTDHDAIRKALMKTDLTEKQIIMPWKGIKFNDNGQNTRGGIVMIQLFNGNYETVWPKKYASHKILWPYQGWK